MQILRYWVGASPDAPIAQEEDLLMLHDKFRHLDKNAVVEQYGTLGSMVLFKVETREDLALDFNMPSTVIAFEHRRPVVA